MRTNPLRNTAVVLVALATASIAVGALEVIQGTEEVFVLSRGDKPPEAHARRINEALEELPEGRRLEVVVMKFHDPSKGMREMVASLAQIDKEGKPHGLRVEYRPLSSNPVHSIEYKHGVRHGEETFYATDPNGKHYVRKLVPWRDGKVHGTMRMWYARDQLMSEAPYENGELSGVSKSYDYDGDVTREVAYKDGKRHGMMIEHWARTGKLKSEIPYRMGKVHGVAKQYYDTGKLKRESPCWEDRFHGVQTLYHESGEVRSKTYWILDEKVSAERFEKEYKVPPEPESRPATQPATRATDKE